MILNSLPKSGSNLIINLFKINDLDYTNSISPTRFLKLNRNLPDQFLNQRILCKYFYNIGYELDAYIEHRLINKLINDQRVRAGTKFVPSHFSNTEMTHKLKAAGIQSVYTIRNPVDVYFSYLRYCVKERNHTFYKQIHQIGLMRFSEKLLYGGQLGKFKLLGWDQVLKRAINQADVSDYVFDYSEYSEKGLPVLKDLATKISETTHIRLSNIRENQILGTSHTFKVGGNQNYKTDKRFMAIYEKYEDKFTNLDRAFKKYQMLRAR